MGFNLEGVPDSAIGRVRYAMILVDGQYVADYTAPLPADLGPEALWFTGSGEPIRAATGFSEAEAHEGTVTLTFARQEHVVALAALARLRGVPDLVRWTF